MTEAVTQPTYAEIDIVKLLRSSATVFYEYSADEGALLKRAATEIERLRARQAAFDEMLEALKPFVHSVSEFDTSWSENDDIDFVFDDSYVARVKFKAFIDARSAIALAVPTPLCKRSA